MPSSVDLSTTDSRIGSLVLLPWLVLVQNHKRSHELFCFTYKYLGKSPTRSVSSSISQMFDFREPTECASRRAHQNSTFEKPTDYRHLQNSCSIRVDFITGINLCHSRLHRDHWHDHHRLLVTIYWYRRSSLVDWLLVTHRHHALCKPIC